MDLDLTIDDLFALLGRKEAELWVLRRQLAALQKQLVSTAKETSSHA